MRVKNLPWIPFAFFAIVIGLYPLTYYLLNTDHFGLFHQKPIQLVRNFYWHTAFYIHITFGGIALLTGWTQFSQRLRYKYINAHRFVGKIYVIAVMLSSVAALFIAVFAIGGIITTTGFGVLAILWFFTISKAYTSILKGNIIQHENWMVRNYALTFSAVTLRIWMPAFQLIAHWDFITAYHIVSWLCWVPNLIIAEIMMGRNKNVPLKISFLKSRQSSLKNNCDF